jgi:hypothetical protein
MRGAIRIALAAAVVGVAAISLLPLGAKRAIGTTGEWHVFGHLVSFAVTGVLFLKDRRPKRLAALQLWPLVALAFALEGLQVAVYGNGFEWSDIETDLLGLVAGLIAYHLTTSTRLRPGARP